MDPAGQVVRDASPLSRSAETSPSLPPSTAKAHAVSEKLGDSSLQKRFSQLLELVKEAKTKWTEASFSSLHEKMERQFQTVFPELVSQEEEQPRSLMLTRARTPAEKAYESSWLEFAEAVQNKFGKQMMSTGFFPRTLLEQHQCGDIAEFVQRCAKFGTLNRRDQYWQRTGQMVELTRLLLEQNHLEAAHKILIQTPDSGEVISDQVFRRLLENEEWDLAMSASAVASQNMKETLIGCLFRKKLFDKAIDFLEKQGMNSKLVHTFVANVVTIRQMFLSVVTNDDYKHIVDRLLKIAFEKDEEFAKRLRSLCEEALGRDLGDLSLEIYGELYYSARVDLIKDVSTRIRSYYLGKGRSEEDVRQMLAEAEVRHAQDFWKI